MLNQIDRDEIANFVKPFYIGETRFFHNWDHILSGKPYFNKMSDEQYIAWMFHDIVYLPGSGENEKNSADYFMFYSKQKSLNINNDVVYQIILDTKTHIATIKEAIYILDIDMLCFSLNYDDFYESRVQVIQEFSPLFGKSETEKGVYNFLNDFYGKKTYNHEDFIHLNHAVNVNIKKYLETKSLD